MKLTANPNKNDVVDEMEQWGEEGFLTIEQLMEKYGINPFEDYSPDDPRYKVLFGRREQPEEPFKHTFQARYQAREKMIYIAETYEGRKAGFFLEEQADRLRAMGAKPDEDFSYAWVMPYTAENWASAMFFIRDTDSLLEPVRTMYGMCWHCSVIVKGSSCPYCGKRVQAWYNTGLEIETGPLANTGAGSLVDANTDAEAANLLQASDDGL